MNIKICDSNTTYFSNISIGDAFKYNGSVYIKTDERHDINAVNLHTGCMTHFVDEEFVEKIRGSFVEEGVDYDY